MLKNTSGIHLILKIGPNIAQPAPYDVTTALTRLEVTDNADERDGFQMTFTLNKVKSSDYNLVQDGTLDPKSRVKIGVRLNGRTEMLIDGIITQHQFAPSNEPGTFTLTVTGEDISLKFDLEEKNLSFRNMSDSAIVQQVLGRYADLGLKNEIDDTDDTPHENQRVTRQASTDLAFLQMLAKRNGFVFYLDPDTFDSNLVHWGEEDRKDVPQHALTMNMGSATNVTSLSFSHNALTPVDVKGSYIDPGNKQINAASSSSSNLQPLAARATPMMRTVLLRNSGQRTSRQASLAGDALKIDNSRSVTGEGQLDTERYGYILRAGGLVGVRGVGASYNGNYYVRRVTHTIERGSFTQSFSLSREGVGAKEKKVR